MEFSEHVFSVTREFVIYLGIHAVCASRTRNH
jgi:hypothetical protein